MKIFTKARVSNCVAGTVIIYSLYAITVIQLEPIAMASLGALIGFASKHLFDTQMQNDG